MKGVVEKVSAEFSDASFPGRLRRGLRRVGEGVLAKPSDAAFPRAAPGPWAAGEGRRGYNPLSKFLPRLCVRMYARPGVPSQCQAQINETYLKRLGKFHAGGRFFFFFCHCRWRNWSWQSRLKSTLPLASRDIPWQVRAAGERDRDPEGAAASPGPASPPAVRRCTAPWAHSARRHPRVIPMGAQGQRCVTHTVHQ